MIVAFILAAGAAAALAGLFGGAPARRVIRVGTKDFTESLVVGELYALALEKAGYKVECVFTIAGSIVHTAIMNDEIDLYPEYTGTGLLTILKLEMMTDPAAVYETVKREYAKCFNLSWLDQSRANDGQGLVLKTSVARDRKITTISDLQRNAGHIRFASQGEFDQRDDGLPGMEKAYGPFRWKSPLESTTTASNTRSFSMTRRILLPLTPPKGNW